MSNRSSERIRLALVLKEVPESIGEKIAHNVAAIAELTQRIKALDASINRLAVEHYPETIYLRAGSGVGPYDLALLRAQSGESRSLPANARHRSLPGPMPEAGPKRRDSTRNCAFPNAEIDTGDACWLAPRSIFWDRSGPSSALRVHGLRLAQREQPRPRSAPSSPSARKLGVLLLTLWNSRAPYESFPTMA